MIDSHCHLSQSDYEIPIEDLIKSAEEQGISKMLNIACNPNDWNELLLCLQKHKNIYGAIGIHPEYACQENTVALKKLPDLFMENPKLLAVGEIGLDYSEKVSSEKQKELFYQQIEMAHVMKKPVIIHTREAETDTLEILSAAYRAGKLDNAGIIHCFSGSSELAQETLKMGFYLSVSGIVTFKSAHALRDIVKEMPLDRLLVETDCPWLAPEPFRGKKNQPAYVAKTLEKVAELKEVSVAALDKITDDNFNRLFLKGKK